MITQRLKKVTYDIMRFSNGHKKQACVKLAFVTFVVALLLVAAFYFLNENVQERDVDQLKYNLSLGMIVALAVIVNLVSFVIGAFLYLAYKWVRRDWKPPRDDLGD